MRNRILATVLFLFGTLTLLAHDPGMSSAELSIDEDGSHLTLTFSSQSTDVLKKIVAPATAEKDDPKVIETPLDKLVTLSSNTSDTIEAVTPLRLELDKSGHEIVGRVELAPFEGSLHYDATFLNAMPRGHLHYVKISHWKKGIIADSLLAEGKASLEVALP